VSTAEDILTRKKNEIIGLYSEVEGLEQGAAVTYFKANISSSNGYLDGPG
jgi:hypothetical protein